MKVLHVLHTTTPDTSGYSVRSKYIVDNQRDAGLDLAVVSSARQPLGCSERDMIDGIPYHRTPALPSSWLARTPFLREKYLMRLLQERLLQVAREFQPDVIHAHSPVLCGIPADRVARFLHVPLVYEVRDFWENASVDKGKFRRDSIQFRVARAVETHLMTRADAVVTICRGLAKEIVKRGISSDKIWLTPNGVDNLRFTPREPDPELIARYHLQGKRVIGYFGSFFRYEGLEYLLRAMPRILSRYQNAVLLLIGSGDEEDALRELVRELEIEQRVHFVGRIPHNQVPDYYALTELLVYPRIKTETTQLTTALKPLEAMSMGCAVVASDLDPMKELILDEKDGLLFPSGNSEALARCCLRILESDVFRNELGQNARETVLASRDWRKIVQIYPYLYEQVACSKGP